MCRVVGGHTDSGGRCRLGLGLGHLQIHQLPLYLLLGRHQHAVYLALALQHLHCSRRLGLRRRRRRRRRLARRARLRQAALNCLRVRLPRHTNPTPPHTPGVTRRRRDHTTLAKGTSRCGHGRREGSIQPCSEQYTCLGGVVSSARLTFCCKACWCMSVTVFLSTRTSCVMSSRSLSARRL